MLQLFLKDLVRPLASKIIEKYMQELLYMREKAFFFLRCAHVWVRHVEALLCRTVMVPCSFRESFV